MPNRGRQNGAGNANSSEEAWCLERITITVDALHASSLDGEMTLLIDSGASSHILGRDFYPYLMNWRKGTNVRIAVADSRVCESQFIADLPFSVDTSDGPRDVVLKDVIYMPEFPRGLVSVAKLAKNGVETIFSGIGCCLRSKAFTVEIKKHPLKDLYFLPIFLPQLPNDDPNEEEANPNEIIPAGSDIFSQISVNPDVLSTAQRKLYDLHASLGHCSLRTLRGAVAKGHIKGVTLSDLARTLDICEVCKAAKLRKHSTNNDVSDYPATQPFERLHGDYGGPYKETWNGKTGFSMFIDEYTSHIHGKLVNHKDECCDHFKDLVAETKLYGFPVQSIHSDSAKEYFEKKSFISWLTEHGVRRTASAPHAQYQNGLAEVTMQQVQNHIRCALFESGLPHAYWGEAFAHVIFTWNRTPKATNLGATPHEMVFEKVPDISFMHPFGCEVFAIHHDDKLPKFSARGRQCVFIGYDFIRKAYRLLTLDDLSILTRAPRDVTFIDHVFPVRECKMRNTLNTLFTEVGKDANPNPHMDYLDFYAPNPQLSSSGGVGAPMTQPSTPPIILRTPPATRTPTATPTLILPSTPMTASDPSMTPSTSDTSLTITPDVHFGGESPISPQNTPPFDTGPLTLQNVLGTTPSFFRSIPIDLPRLRNRVLRGDFSNVNLCEEVLLTEPDTHVQIDHYAMMSDVNSVEIVTPKSYAQAISLPEREKWIEAMDKEMNAIIEAKTYELVPMQDVPPNTKVATPIWSFRVKFDGTFKARLCFPGHRQQHGVDFFETESPVAKFATFRMYMVIVTNFGEKVYHFDIPNAFLNGEIHESVFMRQPPGYADEKYPHYVCSLKKALYGLRQASLAWYIKLDDVLTSIGLLKHNADPCLYSYFKDDEWALVLIYVDDNAIAGSQRMRGLIIQHLKKEFRAKDLGVASRYIGTSIHYFPDGVLMHQKADIEDFLKKAKYYNATPLKTPFNEHSFAEIANSEPIDQTVFRSAIGSLMWYALCTRPDILFAVTSLAQFQAKPTKKAMDAVHRIYRYLRGTLNLGIFIPFRKENTPRFFVLSPYTDASFSIPILDSRSASGVIFLLNGVPVHWVSRKQRLISLSSTEAEIIASSLCAQELLWIIQILSPIVELERPIELRIDNLSMKYIVESVLTSHRTKHLDIRYLFVKQLLAEHPVVLKWIPSEENVADIFTKYFMAVGVFKGLVSKIASDRDH